MSEFEFQTCLFVFLSPLFGTLSQIFLFFNYDASPYKTQVERSGTLPVYSWQAMELIHLTECLLVLWPHTCLFLKTWLIEATKIG